MLPDFFSMLRERLPNFEPGALQDGVDFHHTTDSVFHDSAGFLQWQRASLAQLHELGLRRGPARAVAHAGVELLLDLAIAQALDNCEHRPAAARFWQSYDAALERGCRPLGKAAVPRKVVDRLQSLCGHLVQVGAERFRAPPERSVEVLERAVRGRPRLEMSQTEVRAAKRWAASFFPSVKAGLPDLLRDLEKGLAATTS